VRLRQGTFKVTRETYISPCDVNPVKIHGEIGCSDAWEDDVKLVQLEDVYGKETYINADCVKYQKEMQTLLTLLSTCSESLK
jgi:hypothetical protein